MPAAVPADLSSSRHASNDAVVSLSALRPGGKEFWVQHLLLPALLFVAALWLIDVTAFDLKASDFFFDAVAGVFPARSSVIAEGLMHRGGSNLIRVVAVTALLGWLLSFRLPALQPWRRKSGYLLLCLACGTGLVGLGKRYSNVDCPWDLDRYSGDRPYVHLFADRPDELPAGHCFPGGHSSGAFSLFAFYFMLRDRRRRAARYALTGVAVTGLAFAAGQWVRGAHFPSHDLWSAFICWNVALGFYALLLNRDVLSFRNPVRIS